MTGENTWWPGAFDANAVFRHRNVQADDVRLHFVEGGEGPTIVLIAGFPQSCYAWRRVMPLLATQFHIGSWVGFPYAHQFQDELRGLVLLDGNIPGITLQPTLTLGPDNWRNWHFLFNPIPDLPEALLQGRERILIEWFFSHKTANAPATFSRADIDEFERAYQTLGGMRGMLGYYRAVLEDMDQNREYLGRKLDVPILALGGEVGSAPDIHERMKPLGQDVRGGVIAQSGHYIPEEQPEALAREIIRFSQTLPAGRT
jgi:pimeloyl-ACP methyl ester carboxylesterase